MKIRDIRYRGKLFLEDNSSAMATFDLPNAKENLDTLIDQAFAGDDGFISRDGVAVVRLESALTLSERDASVNH